MIRTFAVALAVLIANPAWAWCLLLCEPDLELQGEEAAGHLAQWLGSLPAGAEVVGFVEGGFQDETVQARLSVDEEELRAVLALLDVEEDALRARDDLYMGPDAPQWFDWSSQAGVRSAAGQTPWLDGLTVAVAPDPDVPGQWRLYLWGFTT